MLITIYFLQYIFVQGGVRALRSPWVRHCAITKKNKICKKKRLFLMREYSVFITRVSKLPLAFAEWYRSKRIWKFGKHFSLSISDERFLTSSRYLKKLYASIWPISREGVSIVNNCFDYLLFLYIFGYNETQSLEICWQFLRKTASLKCLFTTFAERIISRICNYLVTTVSRSTGSTLLFMGLPERKCECEGALDNLTTWR